MTVIELLRVSTEHLKSRGFDNPKTSCEILLANVLGMKRLDLYLNYDRPVTEEERERFRRLYRRRLHHEPLQYIVGEAECMSLRFTVSPEVLIPRPETELVIEKTIERVREKWNDEPIRIVDVGVGCGNIAVSLAHYLPHSSVTGFDVSAAAVEVARANAVRNRVEHRVELAVRDIFSCTPEDFSNIHVVISNPPYVSEEERDLLTRDVVDFEPHVALFTGGEPLRFFRTIAQLASNWLVPGGILVFETGYNTGGRVRDLVAASGFDHVLLLKDYAQLDRIVMGEHPV